MPTSETLPLTQTGLVEVSGWDQNKIFFVEMSELAQDDFAGKHITLRRMLAEGTIIFVRPIQPMALHQANPIPYEAEFWGCSPQGHHQFRLNGVLPRNGRQSFTVN